MPDRPAGGVRLGPRPARRDQPAAAGGTGQGSPFLPWLVALVALSLVVSLEYSRYLFADSYYDLYAGRYIVQHGIPHRNVVTVVAQGAPWIDQQWLAHVLYYAAWAAGGYPAVALLSSLVLTSGFAVLALAMHGRGVPPTRIFLWAGGTIIVYLGNIVIRAQSFGYPLFALTLWLVVADSRQPRLRARTWLVIPVLVLWANTHGSAVIGAGLAALYAAYRAAAALLRREARPAGGYLALAAAAAASVFCTPYGTGILGYYKSVNRVAPALAHYVTEWQRPNPLYLVSMGFFGMLLACVIAVAVAWRRGTRPDPVLAAMALALLVLALTAIRNQAFFAFAGSLLAADTLARSNAGRAPALSRAFSWGTAALLAAAALTGTGLIAAEPAARFESLVPVRAIGAAAALATRMPGARILADEWSSPPMLWLHPAMFGRVGYDARLEQYSVAQLGAYATFLTARRPGWQRLLAGYDLVLVNRKQHGWLATALTRLPGWRTAYSGRDGLVLARAGARQGLSGPLRMGAFAAAPADQDRLPRRCGRPPSRDRDHRSPAPRRSRRTRRRPLKLPVQAGQRAAAQLSLTTSNASACGAWQYRAQYSAVEVTWSGSRNARTSGWAPNAPTSRSLRAMSSIGTKRVGRKSMVANGDWKQ